MLKRAGDQEKAKGNFFCSSSSSWRSSVEDGRGKGVGGGGKTNRHSGDTERNISPPTGALII